jgi:hypothetical protein
MGRFLDLMDGCTGIQRWALDNGLDNSALRRMRTELTETNS